MITREQIDRLKQLTEDLEFYRTLPVPSPELERALGYEIQFLGKRIIDDNPGEDELL